MQDKPMTPNGDLDALKQRLATALSHGDSTPDTQLDLTVGQAVDMLVPMYLRESLRARKQELEDFWDKIGYFQEALFMKARIEEIQAELENLKEDSTIGDVSDIELPPQIKGRLEYHSTQASNPPKELDDLLDGIFGKEAPTPLLEGTTGTEIMAQQSLREGWFVRRNAAKAAIQALIEAQTDILIDRLVGALPEELVSVVRTFNINEGMAYMDGYNDCLTEVRAILLTYRGKQL